LGQLIYAFVNQAPGTARSKKRSLFEDPSVYNSIFRDPGYERDLSKQAFVVSLIRLSKMYDEVADDFMKSDDLSEDQRNALSNGRYTVFGLLGSVYMVVNHVKKAKDLLDEVGVNSAQDFKYGKLLTGTDVKVQLKTLVYRFVTIIADEYEKLDNRTTMSNFLKKDSEYYSRIRKALAKELQLQVIKSSDLVNSEFLSMAITED
jgi:hypothetical protein